MTPTRLLAVFVVVLAAATGVGAADENPFTKHGRLRVAKSGTHLEHADGTPFFFLADTCWTGPALSTAEDWDYYLKDRKAKGFTAIQFNAVCPWRTAPTDAAGRTAYTITDGKLIPNEDYFKQLDARLKAINDAGLLAVPVLAWALKKGDAGFDLSEEQLITLIRFELDRYKDAHCLYVLAGDTRYGAADAEKWKRIGRAVFADRSGLLVTTHPTGMNFPWKGWEDEKWLNVFGYQSGHGDDAAALKWLHSGPPAEYGKRKDATRPLINLEPPYEGHNGYQSKMPHPDYHVRRAVYWSLLTAPPAGVTYGGHGVWSWHTRPGETPTDHPRSGVAKHWKDALNQPGAAQMGYVRKLFESLPWTALRPTPDAVGQGTTWDDPAKHTVAASARTADGTIYVFYFPAGSKDRVRLHVRGLMDNVRWFNPRTGEWNKHSSLDPPDEHDWVLVVKP